MIVNFINTLALKKTVIAAKCLLVNVHFISIIVYSGQQMEMIVKKNKKLREIIQCQQKITSAHILSLLLI